MSYQPPDKILADFQRTYLRAKYDEAERAEDEVFRKLLPFHKRGEEFPPLLRARFEFCARRVFAAWTRLSEDQKEDVVTTHIRRTPRRRDDDHPLETSDYGDVAPLSNHTVDLLLRAGGS